MINVTIFIAVCPCQMLKETRSSQSKKPTKAARRVTKSSQKHEDDIGQGDSETKDSVTRKGDTDTAPPADLGQKDEWVKEEQVAEGEIDGQHLDKSEDYEDATVDEPTAGL